MATPVFCCGFECGAIRHGTVAVGQHLDESAGNGASVFNFDTTTVRSGQRSFMVNTVGFGGARSLPFTTGPFSSGTTKVWRKYINFETVPAVDTLLLWFAYSTTLAGLAYKVSDGKLYAAVSNAGVITFGATGVSVTTGQWYRIDGKVVGDVVTGTCDISVDGTACGQHTSAFVNASATAPNFGETADSDLKYFLDDFVYSETAADYPLGAGYVDHFVPTSDGTHNVAGAADFRRSATSTDILNATTTAYQLVDDVPLKATTPTEYINMLAPPNATDYVECVFGPAPGISTPTTGPRFVEVIALVAQAGTGAGNMEIRLNDNGTMGTVYTATAVAGIVAGKYVRAGWADPPSAATVWNAANDGGNGDFRDLRVRFGSPGTLDVNPDQYFASIMIEAEFEDATVPQQKNWIRTGHVQNMYGVRPGRFAGRSW